MAIHETSAHTYWTQELRAVREMLVRLDESAEAVVDEILNVRSPDEGDDIRADWLPKIPERVAADVARIHAGARQWYEANKHKKGVTT